MQDLSALEGKTIQELRQIASVLGINITTRKRSELIEKIVAVTTSEPSAEANAELGNEMVTKSLEYLMNKII